MTLVSTYLSLKTNLREAEKCSELLRLLPFSGFYEATEHIRRRRRRNHERLSSHLLIKHAIMPC